jgi:hypothetical protein
MFMNMVTVGIKILKDHSEECYDGKIRKFESGKIYVNKLDFKTKTLPNSVMLKIITKEALKDQRVEFLPELFNHFFMCLN